MNGPTVLLVEDNPDDAFLFRHALRECSTHVQLQQVSNGELAMDYLRGVGRFKDRRSHPLPGLVVLDLHMPGSDGLSVLRWIRKQYWLKGLPVVVLSGTDYGKSVTQAMESGADTYLIKGMDTPELVQLLDHANLNWAATAQPPSAVC